MFADARKAHEAFHEEFVMAQVGNTADRLGGEFMIQDRDHMSESSETSTGVARQSEQSQSGRHQQGSGDQHVSGQQGGEQRRKSR
jgi:hypothetical protein